MNKIRLDKTDSTLIISIGDCQIKAYQTLQLAHWGFQVNSDKTTFVFPQGPSTNFISKVINYLKTQFGEIEIGENLQNLVENIDVEKEVFENFKNTARKFKAGKYFGPELNEFHSFIKSLPRKLKQHQLKAAYHLYLLGSAANFSVPGSGKTSVVLSVYEKLRKEGKVNLLFVIGPLSSFAAWKDEFVNTLGRKPRTQVLAGGQKHSRKSLYYSAKSQRAELYLTSFQTLLHDQREVSLLLKQSGAYPFVVVDEAHYIKQVGGNWASAVIELGKHSRKKCVLTGTPFPKSYSDVFNFTDFLWPDTPPFTDENKSKILYFQQKQRIGEARKIVKDSIGPLFYRVRKKDLKLKAQIFHNPYLLKMNPVEKRIYEVTEKNIKAFSKREEYFKNADIIQRLKRGRMMRLRQAVSYTKLLGTVIDDYKEELLAEESNLINLIRNYDSTERPAKVEKLIELISKFKNEKVVVWSNFILTIDLIKRSLKSMGINAKEITGGTPVQNEKIREEDTREKIIGEFLHENSGLNVLIANPAACAESISLHKTCKKAIYYDLSYNCAQYLQSLDRIHRVGGSENLPSDYFYLQYEKTIDQDIKSNLERKAKAMEEIIDEECPIYSLDMFEDDGDVEAYDRLFGHETKKA